jgi:hypothetical protein
MHRNYIKKQQAKLLERSDFYTPSGLHVYFKEPFHNKEVDIEAAIAKLESSIPHHLLSEMEMIIVGWFDEFDEREINAFYKDGALYISNLQTDTQDLYDDIIHEVAHSIEVPHGYVIYGDEKLKKEFLNKREHLHDLLWSMGFKAPKSFFGNIEFNKEFDEFLHKKVGYEKLARVMSGLFVNPYAATSLREYFATGFTDFYLNDDHKYLSTISPELYKKLYMIQQEEALDF